MADETEESNKVENPLSAVKKSERNFDDLIDLSKRRPVLCAFFIIAAVASGAWHWASGESLSKKKEQIDTLQKESTELKRDRDSKATQLAPFLAIAEKQFKESPPDKRMDLLVEMVKDIQNRLPAQRSFSEAEIASIMEQLKQAPKLSISFDTVLGDIDGEHVRVQLEKVFKDAGFDIVGGRASYFSDPPKGLIVYSASNDLNQHFNAALIKMFKHFNQKPGLARDPSLTGGAIRLLICPP
jgi:hypothetical protein